MSQIRAEPSVPYSSRNGMAVDAGRCFKNPAPFCHCVTRQCLLSFFLDPLVELPLRINVNTQEHLGGLHPTKLRALTDIHSNFMWIDPHVVNAVRNQIRL